MNATDTYNYQVVFDANSAPQFVAQTGRARDSMGRFVSVTRQAEAAAESAAPAIAGLGGAMDKAGQGSKGLAGIMAGLGGAMGTAGPAVAQGVQLFDDLGYGARAAAGNVNLLVSSALKFSPLGMALGGVAQVLTIAFKDQIDALLNAAGLLDKNYAAGLEKAKEKTDELTTSASLLDQALNQQAKSADAWAASLAAVSDRISNVGVDKALEQVARQANPLGAEIEEMTKRIAEAEQAAKDAAEAAQAFAGAQEFGGAEGAAAAAAAEVENLKTQLNDLLVAANTRVADSMGVLKAGLDAGGDSAKNVIDQIAALRGENDALVKALRDAAMGLDRVRKENEAFADAIKEGEQAIHDRARALRAENIEFANAIMGEVEAVRKGEEEKAAIRRQAAMDRQQEEARGRLDAQARRVVEAFAPRMADDIRQGLLQGMAGGQSLDQAGMTAFARLRDRLGRMRPDIAGGVADQAARQMVDEQAAQLQAVLGANAAGDALMREALAGSTLLTRLYEQQQARQLQMMHAFEMLRRRVESHRRRFAPMDRVMGNPLGGRF